ncbi:MAG: Asp-tRNA(Asn)/Glu-tRNA(Gln) amidotransferase subunit GatC [Chromatiales bacterium]|nr:Asp-tRNA(Asn)/Glu-tRNA(Gln) amidotransferase subunit GatC [Chromatiales bacterium]
MSLDIDDVARIAHLARISVSADEATRHVAELSSILDLVRQMNAVDTTGIAPMAHPLDATQRLRADEVTEVDEREAFQAIAPAVEDGLYLVPRVIE